jgi:hypothetical protein
LRVERPDERFCQAKGILSRGRYGCFQSHSTCVELGLKENANRTLVFEDDIEMLRDQITSTRLNTLVHDLNHHMPNEWDVLKLGQITCSGKPWPIECASHPEKGWIPRLLINNSLATHAMIWSKAGMERLLQTSFLDAKVKTGKEWDVDRWMAEQEFVMLSCFPQMILQSNSKTSNTQNPQYHWYEHPLFHDFGVTYLRYSSRFADPLMIYVLPWLLLSVLIFVALVLMVLVSPLLGILIGLGLGAYAYVDTSRGPGRQALGI